MTKRWVKLLLVAFLLFFVNLTTLKASSNYDYNTIDDLPETTASFYNLDGTMGTATFIIDGKRVTVEIIYDSSIYYLKYIMADETDMSIFKSYYEVFYYTDDGTPYLVINNGDYSMYKANGEPREVFNKHTLWNLETNELKTFDRLNVYIYSELGLANNLFAYFYVDDFMIDHLISISLRFRFKYNNLFGNPKGEWIENGVLLEDTGLITPGELLSWQYKYMNLTGIASIGLTFIPYVGIPLGVLGTAVTFWLGIDSFEKTGGFFILGDIKQIEKIPSDAKIRAKLNNAYAIADPGFDGIGEGMNIFKLHLGQFNKTGSSGITIDQEYNYIGEQAGINVLQMTYMTDGEVYVQKGENIFVNFTPGPGTGGTGDGSNIEPDDFTWLIAIVVVALIIFAGIRANAFKDIKSVGMFLLGILLLAVVLYIAYKLIIAKGIKIFIATTFRLLC